MKRRTRWRALTATVAFASATAGADVVHDYAVSLDDDLRTMRVEARFRQPVYSLQARSRDAGQFLIDVEDCAAHERIRLRNRRMLLPAGGASCINYTVDLARAARSERRNRYLAPRNFVASPSRWLWRPDVTDATRIRVRFALPKDVGVALPWEPLGHDAYLLGPSPESANAPALFGTFEYHEITVPGATLRVTLPHAEPPLDRGAVLDWLTATATDVSLTYGRFPNPSPFVLVVPIGANRPGGGSAVPFGRVIRDGGETIELFVDQRRPRADFLADWTATHEFSHLMHPYVERESRWITEGFAQYYQNVLLARSGAYEEQKAWQKIHEGLERGRASRPELSPNEAAATGMRGARMKIYWSGAALALLADVRLRERSGGAESLDNVLERLQSCCLPSDRVWSGTELFMTLDSLLDEPVFMPLYRRHADTAGFPDTSEAFARLGLRVDDGRVRLHSDADLAGVRESITRPRPDTARWRQGLASD